MRPSLPSQVRTGVIRSRSDVASVSRHARHTPLVCAVIGAGLYPNVAIRRPGDRKVESRTGRRINLRGVTGRLAPSRDAPQYFVYNELKMVRRAPMWHRVA